MWKLNLKRADFLEIIPRLINGYDIDATEIRTLSKVGRLSSELCLVWNERPNVEAVFPSIIIVGDGEKRDFLAWVSTYASFLRPLTGKTHVIEYENFLNITNRRIPKNKKHYLGSVIGLIAAEVNLNRQLKHEKSKITYRECLETLSFSLGNALFSGVSTDEFAYTAVSWNRVQKSSRRTGTAVENIKTFLEPWGVLIDICNGLSSKTKQSDLWSEDQYIYKAVSEILNNGSISSKTLNLLIEELSIPSSFITHVFDGNRESRVIALEQLILFLGKSRYEHNNVASFIIGYLLNQLEPGTLEYLSLSHTLVAPKIQPILWYGLIAGLHPNTSVFEYASGMGWNMALKLGEQNGLLDPPTCDMDIEEFEMLLDSTKVLGFEKSKRYGSYVIELLSGVDTIVAFKPDNENINSQQDLLGSGINTANIARNINEINLALQKLSYAKSSIEKELSKDIDTSTRQRQNNYNYNKRR